MKRSLITLIVSLSLPSAQLLDAGEARPKATIDIGRDVDFGFVPGAEFPGATGSQETQSAARGASRLKVDFDFTDGGQYVGAGTKLTLTDEFSEIRFTTICEEAVPLTFRVCDANGEWFQVRLEHAAPSPKEAEVHSVNLQSTNMEHWGGDNDGVLQQPISELFFGVNKPPAAPTGSVSFGDIQMFE